MYAPMPMVGIDTRGKERAVDGKERAGKEDKSDFSDDKFRKESLENKVQDFLDRLHQESLNYSLPQAQSFQGPSFHLSMSGGEDLIDISR